MQRFGVRVSLSNLRISFGLADSSGEIMKLRWPIVLICSVMLCVFAFECAAQRPDYLLPRVGTIKDYPATGLMTGCGNLYFYQANNSNSSASDYVFLARGDGSNAWMNLSGRDQRLRQIKLPRTRRNSHRFEYRLGTLRISILFEGFKRGNAAVEEDEPMLRIKITLRRGPAVRIVQAAGSSDC